MCTSPRMGRAVSGEIHGVTGRREASAASGKQEFELRVPADLRTVSRVRRSLEELGLPPTLLQGPRPRYWCFVIWGVAYPSACALPNGEQRSTPPEVAISAR